MSQTASSKFSAACGMENGFAAACNMYLETMVYLSTSSNFDCLLGSLRKEFVISFPPNDEMLPVWVSEAQPEPDASDLSVCLIKQCCPQVPATRSSLQSFCSKKLEAGLGQPLGLTGAHRLVFGPQPGKVCPLGDE